MRKIFDIFNKYITQKVIHKKLLINFIMIFLILEIFFIPFTEASLTTSDGLDGNIKTADSGSTTTVADSPSEPDNIPTVKDGTSTDSSSSSTIVPVTSTDSSSSSTNVDDKSSYTTSDTFSNTMHNSYEIDDKSYDSIIIDSVIFDNSTNSYKKSLYYEETYYAPNERIVSTDEIISKTENIIGNLSSGIEKEVILESSEDIDSVKLTPLKSLKKVKVTVIKLKDKPENIIDPQIKNSSIYKYLDIKLIANDTFIDEGEIKSLEFNFKVEKTWITDNEIDKATIRLIRYHNGKWQNLSTKLNIENESYIFYTAVSPGFSTFAVVGSKVVEKNESYSTEEVTLPWSIIFIFIILLTFILVIILFKAGYIYLKDGSF